VPDLLVYRTMLLLILLAAGTQPLPATCAAVPFALNKPVPPKSAEKVQAHARPKPANPPAAAAAAKPKPKAIADCDKPKAS